MDSMEPLARRVTSLVLIAAGAFAPAAPAPTGCEAEPPKWARFASTTDAGLVALLATEENSLMRFEIAREMARRGAEPFAHLWVSRLVAYDFRDRIGAALVLACAGNDRAVWLVLDELAESTAEIEFLRTGGPTSKSERFLPWQESHHRQYLATMVLGQIGDPRAVEPLIAATRDPVIAYRAAHSLGQIGDARAIPALREMARERPSERHWAGWGLALLGERDGFELLIDVVLSDLQQDQRRHAIWALGELGDPIAVPALIRVLEGESDFLRAPAAEALGQIGDPAALPALRAALDADERRTAYDGDSVGGAAAEAIHRIESGSD